MSSLIYTSSLCGVELVVKKIISHSVLCLIFLCPWLWLVSERSGTETFPCPVLSRAPLVQTHKFNNTVPTSFPKHCLFRSFWFQNFFRGQKKCYENMLVLPCAWVVLPQHAMWVLALSPALQPPAAPITR